ncbi:LysE family translocator [Aquitalea magnusonii]|uniref:LysE family translocator n=1 Tax=Aquitalea magnusonii TaxID=332411 RepID=UPI000AA4ACE7|nr:LysE family transporter [Aquitalea magnusonii]
MDGITNLWAFMAAGLLLNLTPGPDTFYILGRSTAQGSRVGLLSALGIGLGSVGHTLLAAFGLSALLAASAMAFLAVKLLARAICCTWV